MAKAWSYWYPDLVPQLTGCPDPVIDYELRRVAQDFFERTRAWQVIQAPVAIAKAQALVNIVPADPGQELVRIERAWLDGRPINVTSADTLDARFPDDWSTREGTTTDLVPLSPGVMQLFPLPAAAASTGLKLRLSVRPSDTATGIQDDMAVAWREALACGCRGRLMLQADKPWTNTTMGPLDTSKYEAAVAKANLKAALAYAGGRIASRPSFA
jgi:hypothetical protein